MRMSKGQRLSSDDKTDYVADEAVSHDEHLVLFLERFSRATEIYADGNPVAFVNELHQHWMERHPATTLPSTPGSAPCSGTGRRRRQGRCS